MAKAISYYRFQEPQIGPQVERGLDCGVIADLAAKRIRDQVAEAHKDTPDLLTLTVFVTVEVRGQFADTEGQMEDD